MFDINDMEITLESFKLGLISRATGGVYENSEYQKVRKHLLSLTGIGDIIPKFIKTCHTTDEFWQFIKVEFDNYADRRTFLANEINPLIDYYAESRRKEDAIKINSDSYELGDKIGEGGLRNCL